MLDQSCYFRSQPNSRETLKFDPRTNAELVSIARMGAARTVGFDISEEFVHEAKIFAEAANVSSEFAVSDIR